MQKVTLFLLTVLLFSCQPQHQERDAFQKVIIEMLSHKNPNAESFIFSEYECCDTVTLGRALDRSIAIHQRKVETATLKAERYRSEHKRRNLAIQDSIAAFSTVVGERLLFLRDSLSSHLQEPLYYCIRFAGSTFLPENNIKVERMYVTIGHDGVIYNIQTTDVGLHNGMGVLIPGYDEFLKQMESCSRKRNSL